MSGTEEKFLVAKNTEVLKQEVQLDTEQNSDKSTQEVDNVHNNLEEQEKLTASQKMDMLIRGNSISYMKKEIEKLRKEAAKYRNSSKFEESQKLVLQEKSQLMEQEITALKFENRRLAIIRKLDNYGCVKSELVEKDIPKDLELNESLDEFIQNYKEKNEFLFKKQRPSSIGSNFKTVGAKTLTPSQRMDVYIRSALGR